MEDEVREVIDLANAQLRASVKYDKHLKRPVVHIMFGDQPIVLPSITGTNLNMGIDFPETICDIHWKKIEEYHKSQDCTYENIENYITSRIHRLLINDANNANMIIINELSQVLSQETIDKQKQTQLIMGDQAYCLVPIGNPAVVQDKRLELVRNALAQKAGIYIDRLARTIMNMQAANNRKPMLFPEIPLDVLKHKLILHKEGDRQVTALLPFTYAPKIVKDGDGVLWSIESPTIVITDLFLPFTGEMNTGYKIGFRFYLGNNPLLPDIETNFIQYHERCWGLDIPNMKGNSWMELVDVRDEMQRRLEIINQGTVHHRALLDKRLPPFHDIKLGQKITGKWGKDA